MRLETRLALAFGLGYGAAAVIATCLTLTRAMDPVPFVLTLAVSAGTGWATAHRRGCIRMHLAALGSQARRERILAGGSLAVLGAFLIAHLTVSPAVNFSSDAPFRYWADGLEIADAGQVPRQSVQWGVAHAPTISKLALNAFDAGIAFLVGAVPLAPMGAITAFCAVGLAVALLAVGRELGLGVGATVMAGVALMTPAQLPAPREMSDDLDVFRAENLGRLAACCALLLGLRYVRRQSGRGVMAMAAVMFAVAALTHLVPALIAAAALVMVALLDPGFRRERVRRVAAAVTIGVVATAVWLVALTAGGGTLGLERVTGNAAYPKRLQGLDPTASFALQRPVPAQAGHGFTVAPHVLADRYLASLVGRQGAPPPGYALVLVAVAVLASIAVLGVGRREQRVVVVLAWSLAGASFMVALAFSYRYATLVPADFGSRRLFDYQALSAALIAGATTDLLVERLRTPRLAPWATALVIAAVGACALNRGTWRPDATADAAARALPALGRSVPCDTRLLTDVRTAGIVEAYTGRTDVVEGSAPYLRPAVVPAALNALFGARRFFADPHAGIRFLRAQRVDYIVLVRPGLFAGDALRSKGAPPLDGAGLRQIASPAPGLRMFAVPAASGRRARGGPYPARCRS